MEDIAPATAPPAAEIVVTIHIAETPPAPTVARHAIHPTAGSVATSTSRHDESRAPLRLPGVQLHFTERRQEFQRVLQFSSGDVVGKDLLANLAQRRLLPRQHLGLDPICSVVPGSVAEDGLG